MKTANKYLIQIFSFIFLVVGFVACRKDSSSINQLPAGKQSVQIFLNDDPMPNLYKVLVDIRYIEVKVDTGAILHSDEYYDNDNEGDNDHHGGDNEDGHDKYGKWDTVSVTPKIYDLLKLKNGVDTLIANSQASAGKITKIRITLGSNNAVWTDSTHQYPLPLCDNAPYVYADVESDNVDTLGNGLIRIRVDFDVSESIEFENNVWCFEPKIKCYSDNTTGSIEGIVKPFNAKALIKVYNNIDTANAIPEEDGEFKVRGLKPATYNILFKAAAPYKDTLINNIQVVAGQKNFLPQITLHL